MPRTEVVRAAEIVTATGSETVRRASAVRAKSGAVEARSDEHRRLGGAVPNAGCSCRKPPNDVSIWIYPVMLPFNPFRGLKSL